VLSLHIPAPTHRHQQGFTLVEIMVAMVIGMLGIIIMMQMFSLFEGQKRTTTGGDDAQNAGSIALYGIQQNIQRAGYCFTSATSAAVPSPTLTYTGVNLKPVMIDYGPISAVKDTNTSALMVAYGNDACAPESASGPVSTANVSVVAYAVQGGNLAQCDYVTTDCSVANNWVTIAGDVVSMKAECVANQTIRIALVTRNHQLSKTAVTTVAPTWSGTSAINLNGTTVDAGGFTWKNYRYKTFETLAPIRNVFWTGAPGC
jgi:type IV pilus assembly protein PilW